MSDRCTNFHTRFLPSSLRVLRFGLAESAGTSASARTRNLVGKRRTLWLAARRRKWRGNDWKARCVSASLLGSHSVINTV